MPVRTDNPTAAEKIEHGEMLSVDPGRSASGVFNWNGCHNLTTGGGDNLPPCIGHGGQAGPRNAPTSSTAVFNSARFWDGRAGDLEAQAKGPVLAGLAITNTPGNVGAMPGSMPQYVELFEGSFEGGVRFDNRAKAVETPEATLITPTPFDACLIGDEAVPGDDRRAGFQLLLDKDCALATRVSKWVAWDTSLSG